MAPPSQLAIATSSVQRLVKEEASYHKELKNQEARLEKLINSKEQDENAEYQLKQEVCLLLAHLFLRKKLSESRAELIVIS
jgi:predicted ribosome quality control (RQC) complex YloA/Tae2 family protein